MQAKVILETIDFIGDRIDLDSVHPKKLEQLIEDNLVDKVDPMDGELPFFILTSKGKEVLNG